jgi:tetratricopeptide (TPR) repeat protein
MSCLLGFQSNPADPETILAEAKKHIGEGHFPEAIAALNRMKQLAPLDGRAYFFSGIALAESGHLSAAAAELNEAVRLGRERPEFSVSLAKVLTDLGQKRQAVKALHTFEDASRLDPLTPATLEQLIEVYLSLGKTDDALRAVESLAKRQPDSPAHDFYRGKVYQLIGNLDLAQMCMQRSLEKAPQSSAGHYELGRIAEQKGDLNQARKEYLEALARAEGNPEFLYAAGSVMLILGQVDEAIEYLKRAEPMASRLPKIYYALGQAFQRKGNPSEGGRYFNLQRAQEANVAQREKEMREHEELTLVTLGEERLRQGSTFEAKALFQQVIAMNGNNWQANEYLAQLELSAEDWPEAYEHISKLLTIDPAAFESNFLMANYWYQRKNYGEAHSFAQKAKVAQPADADLRNLLGNIFMGLRMVKEAIEEYALAVQYAPDRTDFKTNLEAARGVNR